MKVLVIGCKGSMGLRYMAILDYLKVGHCGVDVGDFDRIHDGLSYDKAIVATPTGTHFKICNDLIWKGKPFLCEKPVSRDALEIEHLGESCEEYGIDGRMVDNWRRVFPGKVFDAGGVHVNYDHYNTGKDGLAWDCIQLYYLAKNHSPAIRSASPVMDCIFAFQSRKHRVTIDHVHWSYVSMVKQWLDDPSNLWSMGDALKATKIAGRKAT